MLGLAAGFITDIDRHGGRRLRAAPAARAGYPSSLVTRRLDLPSLTVEPGAR
jgi:hypothetical protein